jgi:hypothetical protein
LRSSNIGRHPLRVYEYDAKDPTCDYENYPVVKSAELFWFAIPGCTTDNESYPGNGDKKQQQKEAMTDRHADVLVEHRASIVPH